MASSLWTDNEIGTLLSSYLGFLQKEDGTIIRKRLDGGLWQSVADRVNEVHGDEARHQMKVGSQCQYKIECLKSDFGNKKGKIRRMMYHIMRVFDPSVPLPPLDPLLNDGDDIETEEPGQPAPPKKRRSMKEEIDRVKTILERVEKEELNPTEAFLLVEGPMNPLAKQIRDAIENELDDSFKDAAPVVHTEINVARTSFAKFQKLKVGIAEEESKIKKSEERIFSLLNQNHPVFNFLKNFNEKQYEETEVRNSAEALTKLRKT